MTAGLCFLNPLYFIKDCRFPAPVSVPGSARAPAPSLSSAEHTRLDTFAYQDE
jgi:hypothetical protein